MDSSPEVDQTAIAVVTTALSLAGYDVTPEEYQNAKQEVYNLTEPLAVEELEDVIWKMAEWFSEVLYILHPEDPNSLMRYLGERAAQEGLDTGPVVL